MSRAWRLGTRAGWFALALAAAGLAHAADVEIHVALPNDPEQLSSVVYLIPLGEKFVPRAGTTAIVDQIHKQFVPQVSVIETGTAVSFPNKDNIRHHVYSFSAPKPFELKLYSGKPSNPVVFDKPGVVVLGCNIHDVMAGYVVVVDSPWHAVAEADGTGVIHKVPAGDYQVHAWTPGQRQGEHPVQRLHIAADATRIRVEVPAVGGGGN